MGIWRNSRVQLEIAPSLELGEASGIYGQISYTYDSVGNRTWFTRNGQYEYYMYTYGTNRLIRIIGQTVKNFGYDNNGNITSENSRSYTYNQNNRLIQAVENLVTLGEYVYNGVGQRIKKVAGSVTTIYHYDRFGNLIAEWNAGGTFGVDYLYLNGQPLAKIDISVSEALYYYHDDHLGTPQVLTDDQGQVVWKADYKPFGEVDIVVETVGSNLRFPGQYFDEEMGLRYNYHRYYHSDIGRYLRADPIAVIPDGVSEAGVNQPYIYSLNNPINYVDPFGLFYYKEPSPGHPISPAGPEMEKILSCMDRDFGRDLGISGGSEKYGCEKTPKNPEGLCHRGDSTHYEGKAADISTRMTPGLNGKDVMCAAKKCGAKYAESGGKYFHIQVGPGRGESSGELPKCGCEP